MHVRVDHPKYGKQVIMISGVAFLIGFIICLITGAEGPKVWTEHEGSARDIKLQYINGTAYKATYITTISSMMRSHRLFWLDFEFQRPGYADEAIDRDFKLSYEQEFDVHVWGYSDPDDLASEETIADYTTTRTVVCKSGKEWCVKDIMHLQRTIKYKKYKVEVAIMHPEIINTEEEPTTIEGKVTFNFMNAKYTVFEMGFNYFFLTMTTLVMFTPCVGFFWKLCKIPRDKVSKQQKWVTALLVGLWFFDDPFFAGEVKASSRGLAEFYIVLATTFVCILLMFWLVIIDEIRSDGANAPSQAWSKTSKWLFGKIFLCFLIWILQISAFIVQMRADHDHPAFNPSGNANKAFYAFTSIFMLIYIFWVLYLIVSCLHHLKQMMSAYLFLFGLTMFVMFMTIIGIFAASLYPYQGSGVVYLTFTGMYNMYVWILAICYTPCGQTNTYSNQNEFDGAIGGGAGEIEFSTDI